MDTITQEKAYEFYMLTNNTLTDMAEKRGIKKLNDYYELTDFNTCTEYGQLLNGLGKNTVARVFVQMAFHAQNATLISKIVNFEKNIPFLKRVLCGFDPKKFLSEYREAESVVEVLRYDGDKQEGLKWNDHKNKRERKDSLITGYAQALIDCANYLKNFKDAEAVRVDLESHYVRSNNKMDYENLIEYFHGIIPHRFSIALTCDFLKEFDTKFSDLCKPDIHVKDTLCALLGKKNGYYFTLKREYECIGQMQELVKLINEKLPKEEKITVYKLDRMIWLICSGNFFLHNTKSIKDTYLTNINDLVWA